MERSYGMKKSVAVLCAALLGGAAAAAPFSYLISPDKADHIYSCGETATFTVTVTETNGMPARAGSVKAVLDNFGTNTVGQAAWNLSETNSFVISGTLGEPGFLRLSLTSPGTPTKLWSVAYEPTRIEKGSPSPADFDDFWKETKVRYARDFPGEPQLERVPERCTRDFDFFRVTLPTYGRSVHGYMTVPKDRSLAPYPIDFEVAAAGFGSWTNDLNGRKDRICLMFSVYPFLPHWKWKEIGLKAKYDAMNKACHEEDGTIYCCNGISKGREKYFFFPVIIALDRAVDWAVARPDADPSRVHYRGTSQGGGFGFYLTGLNHSFTRAAFFVPACTDTMGYLKGRRSGWPRIVESQLEGNRAATEANAPYFDGANFASRIRCPVRVAVGFADTTCPPCAVYAAFNEIPVADKGMVHGFGMGHGYPAEIRKKLCAWLDSEQVRRAPFDPGERAVFFGDSITHGGSYVFYLQLFQDLRAPGSGARAINGGVSGDTAAGGLTRWDWDIQALRPDSVFTMFGMNDVVRANYKKLDMPPSVMKAREIVLSRYETNQTRLAETAIAAGKKLRVITPSPYDQYSAVKAEKMEACNEPGLARCAAACRRVAAAHGAPVMEMHAPLTDVFREHSERRFCGDRVHPNKEGHLLMAACVLRSLGVSPFVACVSMEADGFGTNAMNADVSDVKASPDAVSFTYAPRSLPFPALPEYVKDDELWPLTRRFNREMLRIGGLSDGTWALKADGREIGRFGAAELERGVNIATLDTPSQRAAREAAKKMYDLCSLASSLRNVAFMHMRLRKRVKDLNDAQACYAAADEWIADQERRKAGALKYFKGCVERYKKQRPVLAEKSAECEKLYEELAAATKCKAFKISVEKVK